MVKEFPDSLVLHSCAIMIHIGHSHLVQGCRGTRWVRVIDAARTMRSCDCRVMRERRRGTIEAKRLHRCKITLTISDSVYFRLLTHSEKGSDLLPLGWIRITRGKFSYLLTDGGKIQTTQTFLRERSLNSGKSSGLRGARSTACIIISCLTIKNRPRDGKMHLEYKNMFLLNLLLQ